MERVGDILIVNADSELDKAKKLHYRYCVKSSQQRNAYRVPTYTIIYASNMHISQRPWYARFKKYNLELTNLKTIHREHGFYFYVDLAAGYFNTRYSTYRAMLRNEIQHAYVTVLFNGYGPYMVYLGKYNTHVLGYDANPICESFAHINAQLNNLRNYSVYTENIFKTLSYDATRQTIVSILPMGILEYIVAICKSRYTEHHCLIGINVHQYSCMYDLLSTLAKIKNVKYIKMYNAKYAIYRFLFLRVHGCF